MALQGTNTNVEHVDNVVVRREAGTGFVAFATERQVVVMPFAILFIVGHVL